MNGQKTIDDFVKMELENIGLKLNPKINGRKGVNFLIGSNEIYLKSIDLGELTYMLLWS